MPGVIDPWDILFVYFFELRNTEKSKRNPSEKKIKSRKKLNTIKNLWLFKLIREMFYQC